LARIFVLNGVNLRSSLGERRPEVHGEQTFEFRQTDHEGELVGWIREAAYSSEGPIVNPGAWTHYSYAIHDALEAVSVLKVEVHLSNVHSREEVWRRSSVISPVVDAVVAGMGIYGYRAAADYVLSSIGPGER
jgi:3-dehydroquinate dehydratase II